MAYNPLKYAINNIRYPFRRDNTIALCIIESDNTDYMVFADTDYNFYVKRKYKQDVVKYESIRRLIEDIFREINSNTACISYIFADKKYTHGKINPSFIIEDTWMQCIDRYIDALDAVSRGNHTYEGLVSSFTLPTRRELIDDTILWSSRRILNHYTLPYLQKRGRTAAIAA